MVGFGFVFGGFLTWEVAAGFAAVAEGFAAAAAGAGLTAAGVGVVEAGVAGLGCEPFVSATDRL